MLDTERAAGFLAARTGDTNWLAEACLAEAVGGLPLRWNRLPSTLRPPETA